MTQQPWVIKTLARLAPSFTGEITEDTPLAENGLGLDSLALADLVGEIETVLAITVREEDIGPETFGTVGRLLRFLESRENKISSQS